MRAPRVSRAVPREEGKTSEGAKKKADKIDKPTTEKRGSCGMQEERKVMLCCSTNNNIKHLSAGEYAVVVVLGSHKAHE